MEVEVLDGGSKMHNIKHFDAALKIGWLKRYLRSISKCTIIPFAFEFAEMFKFGKKNYVD